MREFLFDDEEIKNKTTVTINTSNTDTYIRKNIDDTYWPEILKEFIHMLNGCGYIIDPVKAEKYIEDLSEDNGEIK